MTRPEPNSKHPGHESPAAVAPCKVFCLSFAELSSAILYELLQARIAVFVVEQNCAYQDLDGIDAQCQHLFLRSDTDELLAYARLVPAGLRFPGPAIGRVITTDLGRGKGLGRLLMRAAIERVLAEGHTSIYLGAQAHLERFYGSLGFVRYGDDYVEDGIPHLHMRRDQ